MPLETRTLVLAGTEALQPVAMLAGSTERGASARDGANEATIGAAGATAVAAAAGSVGFGVPGTGATGMGGGEAGAESEANTSFKRAVADAEDVSAGNAGTGSDQAVTGAKNEVGGSTGSS